MVGERERRVRGEGGGEGGGEGERKRIGLFRQWYDLKEDM